MFKTSPKKNSVKNCLEKLLSNSKIKEYFITGGEPIPIADSSEYGGYCDVSFLYLDKNGFYFEIWDYHKLTRHPALKDLPYESQELKYLTPKEAEEYFNEKEDRKKLIKSVTNIIKIFEESLS